MSGAPFRIGHGYDVHRLVPGRALVLGGVTRPWEKGLLGHSDADVALHAVMDAVLGALGQGDIGRLFPDTDPAFAGADSRGLLRQVTARMTAAGYALGNLDVTILAQKPRLAGYIPEMVRRIAGDLDAAPEQVNVKATTEEGLGFTGSGEGIAAHAVVLPGSLHRGEAGLSRRPPGGPQADRGPIHGGGPGHSGIFRNFP